MHPKSRDQMHSLLCTTAQHSYHPNRLSRRAQRYSGGCKSIRGALFGYFFVEHPEKVLERCFGRRTKK